jgi:3-methyladenine DNA glycosylase AlkD
MNDLKRVLNELKSFKNEKNIAGMARYGIVTKSALGISMPALRKMAKSIGKNHELALELWDSGIHEAKILASLVDIPKMVTSKQMDKWVKGFASWDVCDQCCMNLFDRTEYAREKALEWSKRKEEFVKRAGFAIMASLAVHDKKSGDEAFTIFFPVIERESADERNFVRKAVNWALRQIGKRNINLNRLAVKTAKNILKMDSKAAKWIAKDAIRELEGEKVMAKVGG